MSPTHKSAASPRATGERLGVCPDSKIVFGELRASIYCSSYRRTASHPFFRQQPKEVIAGTQGAKPIRNIGLLSKLRNLAEYR
jgi:hypothetical protein